MELISWLGGRGILPSPQTLPRSGPGRTLELLGVRRLCGLGGGGGGGDGRDFSPFLHSAQTLTEPLSQPEDPEVNTRAVQGSALSDHHGTMCLITASAGSELPVLGGMHVCVGGCISGAGCRGLLGGNVVEGTQASRGL